MGRSIQIVSEDFLRGLLDTQDEVGLEAGWAKFENLRTGRARGEPRKGMAHVASAGDPDQAAAVLDGVGDYYEIPLRGLHTLPLKFDIEIAFSADIVTGTEYLWGAKHANYGLKIRRNTTTIEVLIHDGSNSATHDAGTVAATTAYALRVRYDGTTLSTWLQTEANAATVATESGTVSGALRAPGGNILIGADGAAPGSFWDGDIEYVRAFTRHLADFRHLWQYWPHPKGRYVLWDYIPAIVDAEGNLIDHSRNLNYGTVSGTPSSTTTLLPPSDPVQAISQRVDLENESRLVVVAGGVPYEEVI